MYFCENQISMKNPVKRSAIKKASSRAYLDNHRTKKMSVSFDINDIKGIGEHEKIIIKTFPKDAVFSQIIKEFVPNKNTVEIYQVHHFVKDKSQQ